MKATGIVRRIYKNVVFDTKKKNPSRFVMPERA